MRDRLSLSLEGYFERRELTKPAYTMAVWLLDQLIAAEEKNPQLTELKSRVAVTQRVVETAREGDERQRAVQAHDRACRALLHAIDLTVT